jgi:hypothetical protein
VSGSAPLLIATSASDIDENPPHDAGRHRKEMRAILPLHVTDIDELQVRLVDQSGCLKGVASTFMPHVAPGDAAKLGMDHGNELLERGFITLSPGDKQVCDLSS